jgi:hypothetical protein
MHKTYCDRCGADVYGSWPKKYDNKGNLLKSYKAPRYDIEPSSDSHPFIFYDLCYKCRIEFDTMVDIFLHRKVN